MRNTIVSHSKGQQKQIERRVKISANTEMISEKTETKKRDLSLAINPTQVVVIPPRACVP